MAQRVVQPAVGRGVAHGVGLVDVFERIGVEGDEVGELARLEQADLTSSARVRAPFSVAVRST